MTINEMRFLFDGQSSESLGYIMCNIGSINTDSNDEASEIITSTTPFKDTWDFHYKNKSEPLKFPITIAKQDGTFIDANEERVLKKWLCKNKRTWIQVEQPDLQNIYYYCILINPRKENVGRFNAGMTFDVVCDCGNAWSELIKKKYTSNGTLAFNINSVVDYDDYIVQPSLIISPTTNGNITIANITTSENIVINNCLSTETIYLNCKTDKIKSSSGRVLIDDWNKNTIGFCEGNNSISLTGSFTLEVQYRLPIRVGG